MAEIVWEGGVFLKMREFGVLKLMGVVRFSEFSYIDNFGKYYKTILRSLDPILNIYCFNPLRKTIYK